MPIVRKSEYEFVPMTDEKSGLFINLSFADSMDLKAHEFKNLDDPEIPPAVAIAAKRFKFFAPNLQYTLPAILCFAVFCSTPGEVVLMCIDILQEKDQGLLTLTDIVNLYPSGFYSKKSVEKRIDLIKHDKTLPPEQRELKYSEIY